MSRATLYCGDALAVLATLPPESVQCVVTSPPYWGLRDYGTATWIGGDSACGHRRKNVRGRTITGRGLQASPVSSATPFKGRCGECGAVRVDAQVGLERTPEEYIAKMVALFAEVRRVLRNDGTLWLDMGDCYASSVKGSGGTALSKGLVGNRKSPAGAARSLARRGGFVHQVEHGLKSKDLVGIPWRLAFALQADGWWLREDIIWAKSNPMPESVTDRCTRAHEYLFHLAKAERYYHDADAIAEPLSPTSRDRLSQDVEGQAGSARANGGAKTNGPMRAVGGTRKRSGNKKRDLPTGRDGRGIPNDHMGRGVPWEDMTGKRNARSVWTIGTQSYAGAHFATFPEELARRCIVAGSRPGDTVLDPFGGSGTVAQVATGNARDSIYIDLNPKYIELARQRIGPMLCEVA